MLFRAVLIAPSLIVLTCATAAAGPLDPEACGKLKGQLAGLDEQGVKAFIDKGPEAAKGTASKEQLRQVRQYFDLLGNFRFRCPQDTPFVVLKPLPPEDPAEVAAAGAPIEVGSPGITLPAGVAAATVGPIVPSAPRKPAVPKKDAAKSASAATASQPATPGAAAPAAKKPPAAPKVAAPAVPTPQAAPTAPDAPAKAKPKPKSDDAFRPPAAATPAAPAAATPAPVPPAKAP